MYEDHFGLAARPFQLTPDPRFWFETHTHQKAMAYLGYGLAQGEGFIVVTGDIGAGKTTLVGHLMERIDGGRINPIRIVSTQVEADDLLRIVAGGLGAEPAGRSKAELLVLIERGLHAVARTGRRTLLIVDEAQALPVSALEELRMLSNFQAGGHALIQIFLLGQPEFRDRLNGSDRLEQLRQRVIATHHLDPMEPEEVEPYVAHRLAVAGWQGRPDFADDAFAALYAGSGGVPRRLNRLASRVLLHCAVEGTELIDAAVVAAVAADDAAELGAVAPVVPVLPTAAPKPAQIDAASAHIVEPPQVDAPFAHDVEPASIIEAEPIARPASIQEPAPITDSAPTTGIEKQAPTPLPVQATIQVRPPRPYLVPDPPVPAERASDPRPMTPTPPATAPRPIRLAAEPVPTPVPPPVTLSEPVAPPEGAASSEPQPQPQPQPVEAAAEPGPDDRLAIIEARLDAQDKALRRVLTLLVDWVEDDGTGKGRAAA